METFFHAGFQMENLKFLEVYLQNNKLFKPKKKKKDNLQPAILNLLEMFC